MAGSGRPRTHSRITGEANREMQDRLTVSSDIRSRSTNPMRFDHESCSEDATRSSTRDTAFRFETGPDEGLETERTQSICMAASFPYDLPGISRGFTDDSLCGSEARKCGNSWECSILCDVFADFQGVCAKSAGFFPLVKPLKEYFVGSYGPTMATSAFSGILFSRPTAQYEAFTISRRRASLVRS